MPLPSLACLSRIPFRPPTVRTRTHLYARVRPHTCTGAASIIDRYPTRDRMPCFSPSRSHFSLGCCTLRLLHQTQIFFPLKPNLLPYRYHKQCAVEFLNNLQLTFKSYSFERFSNRVNQQSC